MRARRRGKMEPLTLHRITTLAYRCTALSVPGTAQTPRPRLPPSLRGQHPQLRAQRAPCAGHTQHQGPRGVRSDPLCPSALQAVGKEGLCRHGACSPTSKPHLQQGSPEHSRPAHPSCRSLVHCSVCWAQRGGRPCCPPQREGGPGPRCAPGRRQTEHGICTATS